MPAPTTPLDPADYINRESQAHLLTDAFASGDDGYIAAAFAIVAGTRGIITPDDPDVTTVLNVFRALGLRLKLEPIDPA